MNINLPDIPRFYTALAEWISCFICILEVRRRLSTGKFIAVSLGAFAIQALFLTFTKDQSGLLWIVYMAVAILGMYAYIFISCNIGRRAAGYYCVRTFIIAEFIASLHWQIHCYYYYILDRNEGVEQYLLLFLIYALGFSVIALIFKRFKMNDVGAEVSNKELAFVIVIGLVVFMMSNLGFVYSKTPFSGQYMMDIFNVRTLVGLGGVAIIYAHQVSLSDLRSKRELASMENILYNQYAQYQQSQESIDIINYKYHDLKNHILVLRSERNVEKRNEYLDKIEQEIKEYEAQNKTGNKVLDTLLTSKKLYCMQKDICMTCVVDGSLIEFMDVMDICSVFGNALDNAIAHEEKIEDTQKRLIHVSTFSQNSFLIIRFENYCEEKIKFQGELPISTKKNATFHGYGLKSLRYVVRKYGGEVTINVENNWFGLNILIPLK
jgi:Signal transduction histidine kinase regulating citrate/malate metabolism